MPSPIHRGGTFPALTKFASDFTLGFADGLTVPFALTAGMSSRHSGHPTAVISAGLAELCAGSFSMGVGGYLAMRDSNRGLVANGRGYDEGSRSRSGRWGRNGRRGDGITRRGRSSGLTGEEEEEEEAMGMLQRVAEDDKNYPSGAFSFTGEKTFVCADSEGKERGGEEHAVRRHLEPLNLPPAIISEILASIRAQEQQHSGPQRGRCDSVVCRIRSYQASLAAAAAAAESTENDDQEEWDNLHMTTGRPFPSELAVSPVFSGVSVALGYAVGGMIPLFPYFFAKDSSVALATRWSIAMSMLALFVFGAGKYWILDSGGDNEGGGRGRRTAAGGMLMVRRCMWEGLQVLVLGSLAAGVAVLCVQLVDKGA